jgi:transcriptional antiterminator NusG
LANVPQSRFYAVKTTGGQERVVARLLETRVKTRSKPIYSIIVLDTLKGYIFVEAPNAQVVGENITGFKHAKSQVPGTIKLEDLERFLIPKSIIAELDVDDVVEVVAGPFKGMRAKITRVEPARSEVTVLLMDAPYQLPVTIDANYLKLVEKAKKGE